MTKASMHSSKVSGGLLGLVMGGWSSSYFLGEVTKENSMVSIKIAKNSKVLSFNMESKVVCFSKVPQRKVKSVSTLVTLSRIVS